LKQKENKDYINKLTTYKESSDRNEFTDDKFKNIQSDERFVVQGYDTLKQEIESEIKNDNDQYDDYDKQSSKYKSQQSYSSHHHRTLQMQESELKKESSNKKLKSEDKSSQLLDSINRNNNFNLTQQTNNSTKPNNNLNKVELEDLNNKSNNNNKYNGYNVLSKNNVNDFRELSKKADQQLEELEKMLKNSALNEDSDNTGGVSSNTRYVRRYNEMLNDNNDKESTSKYNNSLRSSKMKTEDDLKGSHTLKVMENLKLSFEPIEEEIRRIKEMLKDTK